MKLVVALCITAIWAGAWGIWWLSFIALLGAVALGTAEWIDDERRSARRSRTMTMLRARQIEREIHDSRRHR